MIADDEDAWGAGPEPEPRGEIVPFPRMRPSTALRERWDAALKKSNASNNARQQLRGPLDVVSTLMDDRGLPRLAWPPAWGDIATRMRTYAGDTVGVVGAIGGGKTSFAIQMALANASAGIPVLWLPAELSEVEVISRMVANMERVHAHTVLDNWGRERIDRTLTAVHDMWHFVDRHSDLEVQKLAIERAVQLAWDVYKMPPALFTDHLGQMVSFERDERHAVLALAEWYRELALRMKFFNIILAQSSMSNQASLTGKQEFENSADAMSTFVGGKAVPSVASNCVTLALFKEDNKAKLDAHAVVSKSRRAGREGKVGMLFHKEGGYWEQLDYLPATPGAVREEVEKDKRNKSGPTPRTSNQVREDLNSSLSGDAAAIRRSKILARIITHGAIGMELVHIRRIEGIRPGAVLAKDLQDLQNSGALEKLPGNRYRMIARIQ